MIMKKILLALVVFAAAASFASAGVGILWGTLYGAYDHTVTPPRTGGDNALLDSYSVTWQLIYAGVNNAADAPSTSLGGAGIADDYVTGDDVVWASRIMSQSVAQGNVTASDGTVWSNWLINQSGNTTYENLAWGTAGYTYQRVFEGTPAALSYYFQSSLLGIDTGYTGTPQMPQNSFLDTYTAGFQPDQTIPAVPEPATMSLLGLGALVMAIRRRRS